MPISHDECQFPLFTPLFTSMQGYAPSSVGAKGESRPLIRPFRLKGEDKKWPLSLLQ